MVTWEEYDAAVKRYGASKAYQLGYIFEDCVDEDDDDDIIGLMCSLCTVCDYD